MNILSKFLLLASILFITSCGFTPVYKAANQEKTDSLASVTVKSDNTLLGQFFTTNLENLLNPTSKDIDPKYRIEVNIEKNKIPFAIQQDRTITRYKINVDARYKLIDLTTGETIDSGNIRRDGGYDKVDSDYATYVSDEDTTKRIVKELAEDTRIRIMASLVKGD